MRRLAGALFFLLAAGLILLPAPGRAENGSSPGKIGGDPRLSPPFRASPATLLAVAGEIDPELFRSPGSAAGAETDRTAAVVLHREVTHHFDEAGRATYRRHLIYRLVDASPGDIWSRTEIEFAPWHQAQPAVRARIVTPAGRELWLDARTLVGQPAPSRHPEVITDRVRLAAPLPTLEPGSVVEEEVMIRDLEPFFGPGVAAVEPLQMYAPIVYSRVVLDAPVGLPLRYAVHQWPHLAPRQKLDEGRVELIFEFHDLPAARPPEVGLPPHLPRFPHLAFATGESWQAVAAGYARTVEEQISASDGAALEGLATLESLAALESLEAGAGRRTTNRQRISALLAALHGAVRYTGAELGSSSLVPSPPGLTLERGAGDCKDQATLLVALLRRAGIEGRLALLRSGPGEDVDPRLPGLGRFDHAVVLVPAAGGDPPIWIDPGEPAARPGELPMTVQGRLALVVDPASEKLMRTPSTDSIANRIVEERRIHLADHGSGRVVETSTWSGQPEIEQRRVTRFESTEDRREGYREYVAATYGAVELGRLDESDPEDLSRPFSLTVEALEASHAQTDLEAARVRISLDGLFTGLPPALHENGEQRREPLIVTPPYIHEWRYRIVPPPGFEPRDIPADEERRLGPGRFERRVELAEDELRIDFVFDSGPRILSPEQVEAMRSDLGRFLAREPLVIELEHRGLAAIGDGRHREGFDLLRRLIEEHPEVPAHRVRLVKALIDAGLGAEAVRQAHRATRLHPGSALAFWALGYALEHDEIGRRFETGFPRAEVRDALERAVELAPGEPLSRAALALALERGEEGRKFGRGAEIDAAVEQYRILREELETSGVDGNLLLALSTRQRFAEVVELAPRTRAGELGVVLYLAARSFTAGPDAALRDAAQIETDPAARFRLVEAAAQKLVEARLYSPAARLLRRASRDASRPEAVRGRAVHLERTRRHEEVLDSLVGDAAAASGGGPGADSPSAGEPEPEREAADLARRLLILAFAEETESEDLRSLFHPRYLAERTGEEGEGGVETALAALRRRQPAGGDLPPAVMLDLLLTVVETEADGDPRHGFRVRLRDALVRDAEEGGRLIFQLFFTPHEGRLVIAALDGELGQVGKEVWRRLERNDLRGAHRWLEWAADSLPAAAAEPAPDGDPWNFVPFSHFWTRGTGAFKEKMRLGAALLMVDQPEAEAALPLLEAARSRELGERDRRAVELGLFWAHHQLGHHAEMAEIAGALMERHPASLLAFVGRGQSLLADHRFTELEELVQRWLDLEAEDEPRHAAPALRFLARSAAARGETGLAVEYFTRLRAGGHIEAGDYNDWAWFLLFQDPVPGEALELARAGAELAGPGDDAMFHTLAAVAAELELPDEARQALLVSLEARGARAVGGRNPDGDDAYVLGRLAEIYGFPAIAQEYYARVERPEPGAVFPIAGLAARRLALLRSGAARR